MSLNIFVCEFITSGGLIKQPLPESLAREGRLMMAAVINDFKKIDNIIISTTVDERLTDTLNSDILITKNDDVNSIWAECFAKADMCIIIAPETDGILLELHRLAKRNHCLVLGSNEAAIELSSSKLRCIETLHSHDILTPKTEYYTNAPTMAFPFVLKTDDGVGCDHCYYLDTQQQLTKLVTNSHIKNWVQQEFIEGIHASVCIMSYDTKFQIISINQQNIKVNKHQFFLESLLVNEFSDLIEKFNPIIQKILTALPGLSGYFGVDCIMTDRGIYILEINPRLTTSYCGLAESINNNPMKFLLDTFIHKTLTVDAYDITQVSKVNI